MRAFNILDPVSPNRHNHTNRVTIKAELRTRIDKGRYLILNNSHQAAKTKLFQELIQELEATREYFGLLLDFRSVAASPPEAFYEQLSCFLQDWRDHQQPTAPQPTPMRHHGDFVRWLQTSADILQKQGLLIIDNFSAAPIERTEPLLSLFRGVYHTKFKAAYSIHSIILVDVTIQALLLNGAQSPFNVAEFFYLPDLRQEDELVTHQSLWTT